MCGASTALGGLAHSQAGKWGHRGLSAKSMEFPYRPRGSKSDAPRSIPMMTVAVPLLQMMMPADPFHRARLRLFLTRLLNEGHFRPDLQPIKALVQHGIAVEVNLAAIRGLNKPVAFPEE